MIAHESFDTILGGYDPNFNSDTLDYASVIPCLGALLFA